MEIAFRTPELKGSRCLALPIGVCCLTLHLDDAIGRAFRGCVSQFNDAVDSGVERNRIPRETHLRNERVNQRDFLVSDNRAGASSDGSELPSLFGGVQPLKSVERALHLLDAGAGGGDRRLRLLKLDGEFALARGVGSFH